MKREYNPTMTAELAKTALFVAIGFLLLALAPAILCGTAQAATVHTGGVTYKTYTAHVTQWIPGGPNVKRQARIVKADKHMRRCTIPRYVKHHGKKYLVTEIDGGPFEQCRHLRSVTVYAPLSYVEDQTFWHKDKRHVRISLRDKWARGYLK